MKAGGLSPRDGGWPRNGETAQSAGHAAPSRRGPHCCGATPARKAGNGAQGAPSSPIRYSFDRVRMNRLPWAMAGVAIVNSPSGLRPTTSNVPPARIT